MQKALKRLGRELRGKVAENESMSLHTSFRTGGPADIFITPETADEIKTALQIVSEENIPAVVIGNGSNLLVRDGGIRGAVVQLGAGFGEITADGEFINARRERSFPRWPKRQRKSPFPVWNSPPGYPGP